jgi:hypothetical protein
MRERSDQRAMGTYHVDTAPRRHVASAKTTLVDCTGTGIAVVGPLTFWSWNA